MCLTGRFTTVFLLLAFAIVFLTSPQFILDRLPLKHHLTYFLSYPPLKGGNITEEKMRQMPCSIFLSFLSLPQFKKATEETP
jgi:hypothetical protein